jgi:CheY-like chemotaxis protein
LEHPYSLKIFLVDDDVFCLSLYEQQLKTLGYRNVHTFSNGHECIARLNEMPDIVFLDHDMDNLGGLEVLRIIKANNPDIYVVFLSGQEDSTVIAATLKFGAFDFIVKNNRDILNIKIVLTKIMQIKASLKRMDSSGI